MPGEAIGELAAAILRMFGRVFVEVAVHALGEVAIQGMGYLVCRPFKHDVKPDGLLATVVGLSFWTVFGVLVYLAFRYVGENGNP
jgi:hypothetical protein